MRQETKVILLFLSLITFIVICLYTHLDEIKIQTQKSEELIIKIDETEKKKESIEVPIKEAGEEESIPEKANEEIKENVLETIKEETIQEEIKEPNEEIKEEVIEEPLIKTNPKYIRELGEKPIEELSKASQLLQIEINEYIKDNPIVFRTASNIITKSSNKSIKRIVDILKKNPNIIMEIAGHTDSAGARKVNKGISIHRAKSVKNRLTAYGIDKNRLRVRGYGEDIPLVENNAKGYSKINRRVEFNIVEE